MPVNPTPAEGVVVPRDLLPILEQIKMLSDPNKHIEPSRQALDAIWGMAHTLETALAARPAAPTQSAAQTGEVEQWRQVCGRMVEVMCDCQCEGSHMLSESVANEHADDLRAVLSVFRPSLALSQLEPSQ